MKKIFTSLLLAVVLFGSFAPAVARAEVQTQTQLEQQLQVKQQILAILQKLLVLYQLLAEAQAREGIVATPVTPIASSEVVQPVDIIQPTSTIEMVTVKTFTVTPPAGNTYFKAQSGLTFEQLRDYAVSTNANIAKFRQQMSKASEAEVVEYLESNGFTVVKK